MSGRGWGRGRGRGRGGRGAPDIQDDDGQYVTKDVEGPPPLFPDEDKQPSREEPDDNQELWKAKWRRLTCFWQNSPYNLKVPPAKTLGLKRSLDDFLDAGWRQETVRTGQLANIITLDPKYFPEELSTTEQRRASKAGTQKSIFATLRDSTKVPEGYSFEHLASLEAQKGDAGVGSPRGEKGDGSDNEVAEIVEEDEPDEDDYQDDDYLQGAEYDDDEGYVDDLGGDDGGDEACY